MLRTRVLVIEDEPVQAKILISRLTAEGFDVVVARDGVHAVAMVRKEQPHLVRLDIGLPGGDGWRDSSCVSTSGVRPPLRARTP